MSANFNTLLWKKRKALTLAKFMVSLLSVVGRYSQSKSPNLTSIFHMSKKNDIKHWLRIRWVSFLNSHLGPQNEKIIKFAKVRRDVVNLSRFHDRLCIQQTYYVCFISFFIFTSSIDVRSWGTRFFTVELEEGRQVTPRRPAFQLIIPCMMFVLWSTKYI